MKDLSFAETFQNFKDNLQDWHYLPHLYNKYLYRPTIKKACCAKCKKLKKGKL